MNEPLICHETAKESSINYVTKPFFYILILYNRQILFLNP